MSEKRNIGMMFGAQGVETFLGIPSCPDLGDLDAKAAILGVPCATPYASVGPYCSEAPDAIRASIGHYAPNVGHFDFDLGGALLPDGAAGAVDCGNLGFDENDPEANRDLIRSSVAKIVDKGAVPIVLGGDDSIPIPMIQAFEGRGRFTILQIDAHIDWREEVGGEHWGLSSTMRRASEMPHIENIIQVGQRGLGSARPEDVRDAEAWGVKFISARDVHKSGVDPVLDLIPQGANVIIALDCDGLDPSVIPGVIGRAPGGLTYWQTLDLIHGVADKGNMSAFDIVEYVPDMDVDQIGALTAARIVANVMGLAVRAGG